MVGPPRIRAALPGFVAVALVVTLIFGTTFTVLFYADASRGLGSAEWAAIRFTIWQAFLSAAISVLLAVPVARALARRSFPGRGILISLLGAPFLLPTIVALFGLLAVFGRNGILNDVLHVFGIQRFTIYGLHGVVLAHVFFNLPLATRLVLQGWHSVPSERFRLSASLGMTPAAVFRHIEVPMLLKVVPGALLVIFVICTTSFAVALTLGGGPRSTTVELAIYQAIRFDFDLTRAAFLSVIQIFITGMAAIVALGLTQTPSFGSGLDRVRKTWNQPNLLRLIIDGTSIVVAALFLLVPLSAVVSSGVAYIPGLPASVWSAMGRSVLVAMFSTGLVVAGGLSIAIAAARLGRKGRYLEVTGLFAIAASPLVIGTGLFIMLFPIASPAYLALPVTVVVNAVMTLPFALRVMIPAAQAVEADFGRLSESLNLNGWARMRLVTIPRLRRPIGFSAGIAAALSMGDLGVIALFADPDAATLPLQVYRLMSAYRMDEAAGAATLLMLVSILLFWICDRGGRLNAAT